MKNYSVICQTTFAFCPMDKKYMFTFIDVTMECNMKTNNLLYFFFLENN